MKVVSRKIMTSAMGPLAAGPHLAHGWLDKMGSSGVASRRCYVRRLNRCQIRNKAKRPPSKLSEPKTQRIGSGSRATFWVRFERVRPTATKNRFAPPIVISVLATLVRGTISPVSVSRTGFPKAKTATPIQAMKIKLAHPTQMNRVAEKGTNSKAMNLAISFTLSPRPNGSNGVDCRLSACGTRPPHTRPTARTTAPDPRTPSSPAHCLQGRGRTSWLVRRAGP